MKRKIIFLLCVAAINSWNLSAQDGKNKLDRILNYERGLQVRMGRIDTVSMPEMAIKTPFIVVIDNKIYRGDDHYLKGKVKDSILFVRDIFDPNSQLEFKRILIFTRKKL